MAHPSLQLPTCLAASASLILDPCRAGSAVGRGVPLQDRDAGDSERLQMEAEARVRQQLGTAHARRLRVAHGLGLLAGVCTARAHEGLPRALRQWRMLVLSRRLNALSEEARSLRTVERQAANVRQQLATAMRDLRDEQAAHKQLQAVLKAERKGAAAARQEREAAKKAKAEALGEVEAVRGKEKRAREACVVLRKELGELRQVQTRARSACVYSASQQSALPLLFGSWIHPLASCLRRSRLALPDQMQILRNVTCLSVGRRMRQFATSAAT
eukprot:6181342-Pleurochrysis_carterae.AAC.5